jgi:hypothetical protein
VIKNLKILLASQTILIGVYFRPSAFKEEVSQDEWFFEG